MPSAPDHGPRGGRDDTEGSGAVPSNSHEENRSVGSRSRCSANTSACSGSSHPTEETRSRDRRGSVRWQDAPRFPGVARSRGGLRRRDVAQTLLQKSFEFRPDGGRLHAVLDQRSPRHDHHAASRSEKVDQASSRIAEHALGAVALDGSADASAGDDPQAHFVGALGPEKLRAGVGGKKEKNGVAPVASDPVRVHGIEFTTRADASLHAIPRAARWRLRQKRPGIRTAPVMRGGRRTIRTGAGLDAKARRSGAQLLAAARTTALQDLPTGLGRHPLAEAVVALPLDVAGLEGPLRHVRPRKNWRTNAREHRIDGRRFTRPAPVDNTGSPRSVSRKTLGPRAVFVKAPGAPGNVPCDRGRSRSGPDPVRAPEPGSGARDANHDESTG